MRRVLFVVLLLVSGYLVYGQFGQKQFQSLVRKRSSEVKEKDESERDIVLIVNLQDDMESCERCLRSIFNQKYTNYRAIFIDGFTDEESFDVLRQKIIVQDEDERYTFLRNRQGESFLSQLYYIFQTCQNDEVVMVIQGMDTLSHPGVLKEVSHAYSSTDVWVAACDMASYPSYEKITGTTRLRSQEMYLESFTFLAGLAKQIPLTSYINGGEFRKKAVEETLVYPLLELAKGHVEKISKVHVLVQESEIHENKAIGELHAVISSAKALSKLDHIPIEAPGYKDQTISLIISSENRPMQLMAYLESVKSKMTGVHETIVCYRASNEAYREGYQKLLVKYPDITLKHVSERQSMDKALLDVISRSESQYTVMAGDCLMLTSRVSHVDAIELLEKTGAFHLSMIYDPHMETIGLSEQVSEVPKFIKEGEKNYLYVCKNFDQLSHISAHQMTLYRKKDLISGGGRFLRAILTGDCSKLHSKILVGACFNTAPAIRAYIASVLSQSNEVIEIYSIDELNERFLKGEKIDIIPILRSRGSKKVEYYPHFVPSY